MLVTYVDTGEEMDGVDIIKGCWWSEVSKVLRFDDVYVSEL